MRRFLTLIMVLAAFAAGCTSDDASEPAASDTPRAANGEATENSVAEADDQWRPDRFLTTSTSPECNAPILEEENAESLEDRSLEPGDGGDIDEPRGAVSDDFWTRTPPRIVSVNGSTWSRASNETVVVVDPDGATSTRALEKTRWTSIWPATNGVWIASERKAVHLLEDGTATYFDFDATITPLQSQNGNLLLALNVATQIDTPTSPEDIPQLTRRDGETSTTSAVLDCSDILNHNGSTASGQLAVAAILSHEGIQSAAGIRGVFNTYIDTDNLWLVQNERTEVASSWRERSTLHHLTFTDTTVEHVVSFQLTGQVLRSSELSASKGRTLVATQSLAGSPRRLHLWDVDPQQQTIERFQASKADPRAVRWIDDTGYAIDQSNSVEIVEFATTGEPASSVTVQRKGFGGRSFTTDQGFMIVAGETFEALGETIGMSAALWDLTNPTEPVLVTQLDRSDAWPAEDPSSGRLREVRWLTETQQLAIPIDTAERPGQLWIVQVDGTELTTSSNLTLTDRQGRTTQRVGIDDITLSGDTLWTASVLAIKPNNDTEPETDPIFVRDVE